MAKKKGQLAKLKLKLAFRCYLAVNAAGNEAELAVGTEADAAVGTAVGPAADTEAGLEVDNEFDVIV